MICLALIISQQSGAIHILRYFQREGVTKMMPCGDFHRKLKEDSKKEIQKISTTPFMNVP